MDVNDGDQTLIVEFEGPEEKVQKLLEELEKKLEGDQDVEIVGVTIRKKK